MQLGNLVLAIRGRFHRLMGRDLRSQLNTKVEQTIGSIEVVESDGTRRVKMDHADPQSREVYRQIQEIGNRHKLGAVFAIEDNLQHLAEYAERKVGSVQFVLCHGTRNGAEQRWFRKYLGGSPRVLGTEISSTANQFPDTMQWDFHEQNPEWIGKADIVYSNSWDHSIDPDRMFRNWMECLSERSIMLLEHSVAHEGRNPDALDPFGATRDGLIRLLDRIGAGTYRVVDIIDNLPNRADGRSVVVAARAT
jgi:hypothetical protein